MNQRCTYIQELISDNKFNMIKRSKFNYSRISIRLTIKFRLDSINLINLKEHILTGKFILGSASQMLTIINNYWNEITLIMKR